VLTITAGYICKCYSTSGRTASAAISTGSVLCVSEDGIYSGGCTESKCRSRAKNRWSFWCVQVC